MEDGAFSRPELETTPVAAGRDWSELPVDALVLVFARLGPVEILMGSGLVCRSWLQAAKEAIRGHGGPQGGGGDGGKRPVRHGEAGR
jgi:hypothetical protein